MKLKSIISAVLALAIMLAALPFAAVAEGEPEGVAIDENNFPDEGFRTFVSDKFDSDGDGYLNGSEISIKELSLGDAAAGIKSLKGIEFFEKLETLRCQESGISELDVSRNTNLAYLYCGYTQITSIDVSRNVELRILYIESTGITSLDLSNNPMIEEIAAYCTPLESIDLTGCNKLWRLDIIETPVSSLDLSDCVALRQLLVRGTGLTELDITRCAKLSKAYYCSVNENAYWYDEDGWNEYDAYSLSIDESVAITAKRPADVSVYDNMDEFDTDYEKNGKSDLMDAVYLMNSVLYPDAGYAPYGFRDLDRDGYITADDAEYYLRSILFPDRYLLTPRSEPFDAPIEYEGKLPFSAEYDGSGTVTVRSDGARFKAIAIDVESFHNVNFKSGRWLLTGLELDNADGEEYGHRPAIISDMKCNNDGSIVPAAAAYGFLDGEWPIDAEIFSMKLNVGWLSPRLVLRVTFIDGGNNKYTALVPVAVDPDEIIEDDEPMLGDLDGNGTITSDDAVYLLRYTLFPDYYLVEAFADFDHNGNITSDDAVYLLRYTLFPEYYPITES
ncbi:MAG: hypothetical protein J5940_05845 [Clostridia bacterium]|nr:hypothetical protein [Clostridia bacterium]